MLQAKSHHIAASLGRCAQTECSSRQATRRLAWTTAIFMTFDQQMLLKERSSSSLLPFEHETKVMPRSVWADIGQLDVI